MNIGAQKVLNQMVRNILLAPQTANLSLVILLDDKTDGRRRFEELNKK
jgi:hypothetical protein